MGERILADLAAEIRGDEGPGVWFAEIRDDLRRVAHLLLAGERAGHTLQTDALLNEAWIKLFADGRSVEAKDQAELIRKSVSTMHNILIDHARGRNAEKRGGYRRRVPLLDDILDRRASRNIDTLALKDALTELSETHPRPALAMRLRMDGGFKEREIAALLGVTPETIRTDRRLAEAWLSRKLGGGSPDGP